MADIDTDALSGIVDAFIERRRLTPAERAELLRIAQGLHCKDSAGIASVSPETIRARRKRIYRKLGVGGANEALSSLLALSLRELAAPDLSGHLEGERGSEAAATLH